MALSNLLRWNGIIISLCVLLITFPAVHACGCGIVLDPTIFNDLKETEAYLLIEVHSEDSYTEKPFFRMFSLEEPYNTTLVFPMDSIPVDVKGESMTPEVFLEEQGITDAEEAIERQSFNALATSARESLNSGAKVAFSLANGAIGGGVSFLRSATVVAGSIGAFDSREVAHFEFEGGTLDLYDVESMETLEQLVATLNITMSGEVADLVTKYSDHYVAVLKLRVPSVLTAEERERAASCPDQLSSVKALLRDSTELDAFAVEKLIRGPCSEELRSLVARTTDSNDFFVRDTAVNGTLVSMTFENDHFFYPTSIVNSYEYPVQDERYFVTTPKHLDIALEEGIVQGTGTLENRWYRVQSADEDLKGIILPAAFSTRASDVWRLAVGIAHKLTWLFTLLVLFLLAFIPAKLYTRTTEERPTRGERTVAIVLGVLLGILGTSIYLLFRKRWLLSLSLFSIWLLYLLAMLL